MQCFDWQNRASDYLDGTLIGSLKREADDHLENCETCYARYKHYRLVLTSIASQPRNALPVAIRKTPMAANHRKKIRWSERIGLWSTVPWYVRVPLEGAGIVILISVAISAGPRLRTLYEKRMERSLTEYSEGLGETNTSAEVANMGRGNVAAVAHSGAAPSGEEVVNEDDFSSSEGGGDEDSDKPVKAGAAETWRFNLKTDSPLDVRTKIVKILNDLKVPSTTAGIGGIEAPGGIQFDLLIPQTVVVDLKTALEKIAPPPVKELEDSPFGETFTWYKNKSKHPLPQGQTHVVIWLSQI